MTDMKRAPSARRGELLDAAYHYALAHGLVDLSLRPLAAAIGSSPRVLLFLFGSKDGLVRELLAMARRDELALLTTLRGGAPGFEAVDGLSSTVRITWRWLVDGTHRPLLMLWCEAYARSLVEPGRRLGGLRPANGRRLAVRAGRRPNAGAAAHPGRPRRTHACARGPPRCPPRSARNR